MSNLNYAQFNSFTGTLKYVTNSLLKSVLAIPASVISLAIFQNLIKNIGDQSDFLQPDRSIRSVEDAAKLIIKDIQEENLNSEILYPVINILANCEPYYINKITSFDAHFSDFDINFDCRDWKEMMINFNFSSCAHIFQNEELEFSQCVPLLD